MPISQERLALEKMREDIATSHGKAAGALRAGWESTKNAALWAEVGLGMTFGVFETTKLGENTPTVVEASIVAAGGIAAALISMKREGTLDHFRAWNKQRKQVKQVEQRHDELLSWMYGPLGLSEKDKMVLAQFQKDLSTLPTVGETQA